MYRRSNRFSNRSPNSDTPLKQEREEFPAVVPVVPCAGGHVLPDLSTPPVDHTDQDRNWSRFDRPTVEPLEPELSESLQRLYREAAQEQEELYRIENSIPLGAARHIEPPTIHSLPHIPAWKRKLRP